MAEGGDFPDRVIGSVTVLFAADGGRYPQGNALLVRGRSETAILDPGLGVVARRGRLPRADRVIHSHCHEDHIAGSHLYPDVPWHVHELDRVGFRSLDDMLEIYGYPEPIRSGFRRVLVERFHYTPRPDAVGFGDGHVFDLGGGVRVRALHAPGHTRGHCLLHVEPDDVLYLGDVDLTSFGPYYGDAWSSLEDFERTIDRVRGLRARHYATYHHIGVLDDRDAFLARLDRFAGAIERRERSLLEFLAEPHDLDEIARHRFVYRPENEVPFADAVERRSMSQHVDRLLAAGRLVEVEPGRYRAP